MPDQLLKKLGFNEKEIVLYLELLRRGKATPASLARTTDINRATIYSTAKTLLERGVITEDLAGKSLYLVALPPESLAIIVESEERALKQKRTLVRDAIDALSALPRNTQYAVPQIRFVEDESVSDHLYKQFGIWQESADKIDGTWWGFQDHTFVEHFQDWIEWTWQQNKERYTVRLLSNKAVAEETIKDRWVGRRKVRLLSKASDFTASTWIVGDYIVMVYTNERPFYLIEIRNSVLAHNMREIFKALWEQAEIGPKTL